MNVRLEARNLSLFFSMDGQDIIWYGRLDRNARSEGVMSDKEYLRHRTSHPVMKVLGEDTDEMVVKTSDGHREHWLKPRWFLRKIVKKSA
jgi:hypothetical protein